MWDISEGRAVWVTDLSIKSKHKCIYTYRKANHEKKATCTNISADFFFFFKP